MRRACLLSLAAVLLVSAQVLTQTQRQPASPPPDSIQQEVLQQRYALRLSHGQLAGPGAAVLKEAIAASTFVLIGEEHGTAQTPALASAVCDVAMPLGFHAMAIETGAGIARQLEQFAAAADPRGQVAAFEGRFPGAIPFYNSEEEIGFLAHCAADAARYGQRLQLWGLDQAYIGAGRFLLEHLLAAHPGHAAEAEIRRLLDEDRADYQQILQTGDIRKAFLLSAPQGELDALTRLIDRDGSPEARRQMASLLSSRALYEQQVHGQAAEANRARAQDMKEAFLRHEAPGRGTAGLPKVLLKFGAAHLYRGINPLHNDDLGNFISELADGRGLTALHLMVVGAKGSAASFGVPGQTVKPETFDLDQETDPSVAFIKPFLAARLKDGWTVYDLRALRTRLRSRSLSPALDRLVFGYDLLVVVPEVTPATAIPRRR